MSPSLSLSALLLACALGGLGLVACGRENQPPSAPSDSPSPSASGAPGPRPSASVAEGAAPGKPEGREDPPSIPPAGPIVFPASWTTCVADNECVIAAVGCCSEAAVRRTRADEARALIRSASRALCPVKAPCPLTNDDGQPAACRQQRCLLPQDQLSLAPGSGPSSPALAASTAPDDASPDSTPPDPGLAPGKRQKRSTFQCFSWFHGRQSSTDCYRTGRECAVEKKRMEDGARPTAPCERVTGASCTMVSRPEAGFGPRERCFSRAHECESYRAFVLGNHLTVTPCEDR